MGEHAIAETVIAPIRRQEPGHFAFYRLSAEVLLGEERLSDWQLHLARVLRRRSFELVGVNNRGNEHTSVTSVVHSISTGISSRLRGR